MAGRAATCLERLYSGAVVTSHQDIMCKVERRRIGIPTDHILQPFNISNWERYRHRLCHLPISQDPYIRHRIVFERVNGWRRVTRIIASAFWTGGMKTNALESPNVLERVFVLPNNLDGRILLATNNSIPDDHLVLQLYPHHLEHSGGIELIWQTPTPCSFVYSAPRYKNNCFVFQWNNGVKSKPRAQLAN